MGQTIAFVVCQAAKATLEFGVLGPRSRVHAGSDPVEITSKINAIQNADLGTVWIYHVPESWEAERLRARLAEGRKSYSDRHPDVVALKNGSPGPTTESNSAARTTWKT